MKTEETLSNNSNPNVGLLNDLLAKMSDDPNESVESRFGRLLALYFKNDIKGFISCMEVAFTESYPDFGGPKPWEDPDIQNCDFCHPSYAFLITFEERSGHVCHGHQLRWMIEKSLFSAWQQRAEQFIKDWDSSYYQCWLNKKRRSQESETGHPENSGHQMGGQPPESSVNEPDALPMS